MVLPSASLEVVRGGCVSKVLVDACGWVAIIDGNLNVDIAMRDVIGQFEPIVLKKVWEELQMVEKERKKPLLLEILENRAEFVDGAEEANHPDDQLVILASETKWPVLTVDRKLKQRLIEMGCSYIEVMAGNNLRLVSL